MSTKRTQRKGGGGAGGETECASARTKKPKKKKETNAENGKDDEKKEERTAKKGESEVCSTRTKKTKNKKNNKESNVEKDDDKKEEKTAKKGEADMCSTRTKKPPKQDFNDEAKNAAKQFTYQTIQNGLHQLRVQFNEIKSFVPADSARTHNDANQLKCRYKDVPCWDRTRVVLTFNLKQQPGNDFVHANRVTHELLDGQQFICCQGPLDATVPDFWRCVWQEKVKQIIMLCRCEEMGKNKCAQYWPQQPGAALSYHGLTIKCEKVDASDRSFIHTKLSLNFDNETRTIDHRQWTSWPDKSVPKTPMAAFRLLNYTRRNPTNIIHCSAGVGRTGTLVIIEMMYKSIMKGKIPDVVQLVKDVRAQRAQAVQTEDQYLYCHYALLQLLHIKKIVPSHFVKHYIREYEGYLKLLNDVGGKNLPMAATNPPVSCANCVKVAAQMHEAKQADSPPSEGGKHDNKKDSKREGAPAGGGNDRKANILKQLKNQKEEKEKRAKQQQQHGEANSPIPEATTKDVPEPCEQNEEPKPGADIVSQYPNVTENNVDQNNTPTQSPQLPPSVPEQSPQQQFQAHTPPLQQQQFQAALPPPPPPQQFQAPPPQQQCQSPPQHQQQQFQAAPLQMQQQYPPPATVDGGCQMQQQQPAQCEQQKFKYTPAATYTVQQAGNKKAIVYQNNANQPFIKAIASPAGVPQQMCLVAPNGQQPPQQQQLQQQPQQFYPNQQQPPQ